MKTTSLLRFVLLGLAIFGLAACGGKSQAPATAGETAALAEVQIVELPLTGEAAKTEAEYSGLAWYGDTLILLPQYPARFGNHVMALPKAEILAYLDGTSTAALTPQRLPFDDGGLAGSIRGFEGYEAIGFNGDAVYLTIEARGNGYMTCYVAGGGITSDLSSMALVSGALAEIVPQADLDNMCDEALLISNDLLMTFYEANGANVNPVPLVHFFDLSLSPHGTIPLPHLEYRLTDVTAPDAEGRFWAINYLYPGDAEKLVPADDLLAARFGVGESHVGSQIIERLVEFQITEEGIVLTDTPPIWLQLEGEEARNWEGIVRLDGRGFLLVTDKFPKTILAFVPLP